MFVTNDWWNRMSGGRQDEQSDAWRPDLWSCYIWLSMFERRPDLVADSSAVVWTRRRACSVGLARDWSSNAMAIPSGWNDVRALLTDQLTRARDQHTTRPRRVRPRGMDVGSIIQDDRPGCGVVDGV
ncbi:hypothetical protein [Phaffia rhodozyma]|uniref:Uncharacterized protein n=1 Tax=Phaffia rhodozyma TaxID=264483 RepID=A0A0F7SHZ2_PHARH|nr:hypothetical protein [Phaffia rhodozyma]